MACAVFLLLTESKFAKQFGEGCDDDDGVKVAFKFPDGIKLEHRFPRCTRVKVHLTLWIDACISYLLYHYLCV